MGCIDEHKRHAQRDACCAMRPFVDRQGLAKTLVGDRHAGSIATIRCGARWREARPASHPPGGEMRVQARPTRRLKHLPGDSALVPYELSVCNL